MDFAQDETTIDLERRLLEFMDDCVYPAEERFRSEVASAANPWGTPAVLEELKADAERNGHKSSVNFHGHPIVTVRPAAFKRCLATLVSHAARHAPRPCPGGSRRSTRG